MKKFEVYRNIRKRAMIFGLPIFFCTTDAVRSWFFDGHHFLLQSYYDNGCPYIQYHSLYSLDKDYEQSTPLNHYKGVPKNHQQ